MTLLARGGPTGFPIRSGEGSPVGVLSARDPALYFDLLARALYTSGPINWTARPSPFDGNAGLGVAYGGGLWVAVGRNAPFTVTIATSPDGINWTARTSPFDGNTGLGVAYGGGLWVAVGSDAAGTVSIATSPDWQRLD